MSQKMFLSLLGWLIPLGGPLDSSTGWLLVPARLFVSEKL